MHLRQQQSTLDSKEEFLSTKDCIDVSFFIWKSISLTQSMLFSANMILEPRVHPLHHTSQSSCKTQ